METTVFNELWRPDFVPYLCPNSYCDRVKIPAVSVAELTELFDYAGVDTKLLYNISPKGQSIRDLKSGDVVFKYGQAYRAVSGMTLPSFHQRAWW